MGTMGLEQLETARRLSLHAVSELRPVISPQELVWASSQHGCCPVTHREVGGFRSECCSKQGRNCNPFYNLASKVT